MSSEYIDKLVRFSAPRFWLSALITVVNCVLELENVSGLNMYHLSTMRISVPETHTEQAVPVATSQCWLVSPFVHIHRASRSKGMMGLEEIATEQDTSLP